MDANLTFNTIAFNKSFDVKDESKRVSSARGVNTPDELTIRTQEYVDSATQVAGRRFTARVDRVALDANSQKYITSAYFVLAIPGISTSTDINNVVATFKAIVADADFITEVLNSEK